MVTAFQISSLYFKQEEEGRVILLTYYQPELMTHGHPQLVGDCGEGVGVSQTQCLLHTDHWIKYVSIYSLVQSNLFSSRS